MRNPVLYFFLLVLGVPFDLTPEVTHERGRFSETLSEKGLELVPGKGGGPVSFFPRFVLLPAEVDSITEERGRERDAFMARGTSCLEMILALSTEVVTFHMQAPIVQAGVLALRGLSRGAEFAWPCSWPLTNDSRANLVALCRSTSVYVPGGLGAGAGVGVGVVRI